MSRLNKYKKRVSHLWIEIGVALLALFSLSPFYLIIMNSFKSRREVLTNTLEAPKEFKFDNYLVALERMEFLEAICNTFILTTVTVVLLAIFCSMAAWVLVRTPSKLSKFFYFMIVGLMLVPFQVVMIPLIKLMGFIEVEAIDFHMLRSLYGLIFMYIGFGSSFTIFMYHGFIKSTIPKELEEAALIDGCSKPYMFLKVVFPMLKPITMTLLVLNSLWIWNDYLLPKLTLGVDIPTLQTSLAKFFGQYTKQWELGLAGLVMAIIPIVIFYFIAQKHIIKGIAQGAIK